MSLKKNKLKQQNLLICFVSYVNYFFFVFLKTFIGFQDKKGLIVVERIQDRACVWVGGALFKHPIINLTNNRFYQNGNLPERYFQ